MGNYKFRLSDMIPNAWFHKLKYMTRPRNNKTLINPTNNNNQITSTSSSSSSSSTAAPSNNIPPSTITSQSQSSSSDQRKSYYFSRDLTNSQPNNSPTTRISVSDKIEPPRKSSRRRRSTKRMIISRRQPPSHQLVSSSLSAGCSCRATLESVVWTKPPEEEESTVDIEQNSSSEHESLLTEYGSDRGLTPDTTFDGMLSLAANSCKCRTHENDVVSEVDNERISDHLRPIITKKVQEPTKTRPKTSAELSERSAYGSLSVKLAKEDFLTSTTTNNTVSPVRRSSSSPGVKLRTNSPRIANRRIQGRKSLQSPNSSSGSRRSVTAAAETFAVVKTSKDPRRDFRESMVEMIVENNLRASKDLEELLACYLSLNSDEYHDVIINVFKQIWFDFVHLRLK